MNIFFGILLDSLGGGELIFFFFVVLILLGPKQLPEIARKVGNIVAKIKLAADEFERQLFSMDREEVNNEKGDNSKN